MNEALDTRRGSPRSPGGSRRRGAALEQAIFDATWDLLMGGDHTQLTMAAVAAQAGTSKPVLYRRWANRTELVLATLHDKAPAREIVDVDHGTLREDLIALLHSAAAWFTGLPHPVVHTLRSATVADPELRTLLPARIGFVDIRPAMLVALERAARRGQANGRPVEERVLRLPLDLMYIESLHEIPVAEPERVIAEIVDQIMLPLLTAGMSDSERALLPPAPRPEDRADAAL